MKAIHLIGGASALCFAFIAAMVVIETACDERCEDAGYGDARLFYTQGAACRCRPDVDGWLTRAEAYPWRAVEELDLERQQEARCRARCSAGGYQLADVHPTAPRCRCNLPEDIGRPWSWVPP